MRDSLTVGIAGAGGDGVGALGSFLQKLAAWQGYFSQMPKYYGAQIRGDSSAVKLSLDTESLSLPKDNLDILVCFNWGSHPVLSSFVQLDPGVKADYGFNWHFLTPSRVNSHVDGQ